MVLGTNTPTATVETLATLSKEELERFEILKKQVAQIEADDPIVRSKEFKGRATRLDQLKNQLDQINNAVSDVSTQNLREGATSLTATSEAAKLASKAAFWMNHSMGLAARYGRNYGMLLAGSPRQKLTQRNGFQ
jgi:hypothetical protein